MPVSAPPRVLEHLRNANDGPVRVLHRGRHAVYVEVADRCVGVVSVQAAQVPCALRSAAADLGGVRGDSAHLLGGVLHLDGSPMVVGRLVDVRVGRIWLAPGLRSAAAIADVARSVPGLVGYGEGLTPAADDWICGWLSAHRAAGVATPAVDDAVRDRLNATTLLSATLLDCALHGEVLPELAAWLTSVGTPDEPVAAAALRSVGHTSGPALLEGARTAVSTLAPQQAAA